MRINGRNFDSARSYYYADWHLQTFAGSARLFPEFTPTDFVALRFMFMLLKQFLKSNICCHVGGSFPTYLAGVQTCFHRVTIFIALKNTTLINLIFQRRAELVQTFHVGQFEFSLYDNLQDLDVCSYVVKQGDQDFGISFVGIDCAVDCGTLSNVDFVHFMRQCLQH